MSSFRTPRSDDPESAFEWHFNGRFRVSPRLKTRPSLTAPRVTADEAGDGIRNRGFISAPTIRGVIASRPFWSCGRPACSPWSMKSMTLGRPLLLFGGMGLLLVSRTGNSGPQIQVLDISRWLLLCRRLRLLRGLLLCGVLLFHRNCPVPDGRAGGLGVSYPPIPASTSATTADDRMRFMMLSFYVCGGIAAVKRQ